MSNHSNPNDPSNGHPSRGDTIRADIILSVAVIAFIFMFLVCCWGCINPGDTPSRRRRYYNSGAGHTRRRTHRRTNRALNVNPNTVCGLEATVLKSLPVFTYSSKTHPDSSLDCAVCLSQFEENESGRVLPKCNHIFHVECIDMWFHSHSTCPTCRELVKPGPTRPNIPAELVLTITEPDSGSGLCQHEAEQVGTSSFGGRKKPIELDVPRRNTEEFENGSTRCDSPASQSVKSPITRMLSLKRILSRERRDNLSPPSVNPASCGGSVTESDIERGKNETKQTKG